MNVACGACPAKYVIPDEKVRGRKVRIPCKRCGAAIIIDGTAAAPETAGTPLDGQVSPDAPAKSSLAAPQAQKPKPLAATSPRVPVAPPLGLNGPPAGTKQAVRPQRAIRQTIIGVAAPANAPESAPARTTPIRRPTPIYVRSPNVTAQSGPISPEQQTSAAPGKMRSLRHTMVGGLDTEEPATDGSTTDPTSATKSEVPPVASLVAKTRSREIKHTIIGGLEAAIGSAPGAEEPRKRAIPRQDTPPGTWMAILPDGKTLRITESELPRALSKAYVTGETPFWRTGMPDWVRLSQIPELSQLLNRTSARPQPKAQVAPSQAKSVSRAPNTTAPNTQLSQPAPVPSFSRPPTAARLPVPSPSTPKPPDISGRGVTSSFSAQMETSPFTPSAAKVSRGPASVSARSSSPSLELVELDNDDEVAGLISAQVDDTSSNSNGIHELQRLAASVNSPPQPGHSNGIGSVQVTQPRIIQSSLEVQTHIEAAPSIARRKPSRTLRIAIILILLMACSVTSLVTRQPRPLYNYLHARGWDQTLDMLMKSAIEPALAQIRRLLGR